MTNPDPDRAPTGISTKSSRASSSALQRSTRAGGLVSAASEKVELAEHRFDAIDAERRELEAEINEANLRAQEADTALRAAESRIALVEAELSAGEKRAAAAETRAQEAIAALAQVEDAIRTHLLHADRSSRDQLSLAA